MLLAHLSDPHLIDWSQANWRSFIGKRMTGAANFAFRRARVHRPEVLDTLLADIVEMNVDHVAITGDLSSLAFRSEIQRFAHRIRSAGLNPDRVSIIPGNHDAYTTFAWQKRLITAELGAYTTCDLHRGMPGFPFVRLRGPLALIGLDSAVPRPWFMANGLVGKHQLKTLTELLRTPHVRSRFPVILIHHPPIKYPSWIKEVQSGLLDRQRFLHALGHGLEGREALVLSGHWHKRQRVNLGISGNVELLIAPSASHWGGGPLRCAAYHLITINEKQKGRPSLTELQTRLFDPDSGIVSSHSAE